MSVEQAVQNLMTEMRTEILADVRARLTGPGALGALEAGFGRSAARAGGKLVGTVVRAARHHLSAAEKAVRYRCPVPACKGIMAPVFGMVCAKHKGLPKAKIAKYRAQARRKGKR